MSHSRTGSRPGPVLLMLILSLALILGALPATAAPPDPKPAHSTYSLSTTLPQQAFAGLPVSFETSLAPVSEGQATYGRAAFQVAVEGPGEASFIWSEEAFQVGPEGGPAPAGSATFPVPGSYQVTLSVVTPDKQTLAEVTSTVTVFSHQLSAPVPADASVGSFVSVNAALATTVPGAVQLVAEKVAGPGDLLVTSPYGGAVSSFLNHAAFDLPAASEVSVPLNLKFAKAGTYTVRISAQGADGQPAAPATLQQVSVQPSFQNLGPQVTSQLAMRGVFGTENGRPVTYTVLAGTPSIFTVIDVETEKAIKSFEIPEIGGAWGQTVASDGKVYFASYNEAKIFQYDPVTSTLNDLGDPAQLIGLPKTTQYFELVAGTDGRIYGGGYPNGNVFEYDPATGFRNFGQIVPGTQYPRSVAYDAETHTLFVGGGAPKAWLIKVDLATGQKSGNLLPATDKNTYTYDMNVVGDKLILKMDPTFQLYVLDKNTLQVLSDTGLIHSRGVSPVSPYENKVYITYSFILKTLDLDTLEIADVKSGGVPLNVGGSIIGSEWVQLDDPAFPGYSLVGWSGNNNGLFMKYNPTTGALRVVNLSMPKAVAPLHTLAQGPDGKIYASAYLSGGMGILDPLGLRSTSNSMSQVEGMASLGTKLFMGVYPGAKIFEYDTTKAWKSTGSSGRTVTQVIELATTYEQDRPYAMLGVPELGRVFIGTVPNYGKRGGALTVFNPATKAFQVYRNIVEGQSITSLAYKSGVLYGASSFRGGLGAEDVFADARIFAFDPVTQQKLWEAIPFPGTGAITNIIVGPDGNLWGWAMGRFFTFDPATRQVLHSELIFTDAVSAVRDAQMEISRFDGKIYGSVAGRFFQIDPATLAVTVLRTEPTQRLAQDSRGNFYFADGATTDGSNLWRLAFDDGRVPVTSVSISAGPVTLAPGAKQQLAASVQPTFATVKDVTWATSNAAVAQVAANGLVTAVSPGTATISVLTADGNFLATVTVTVQ